LPIGRVWYIRADFDNAVVPDQDIIAPP
jgi:hypothetical protein